MNINDSITLVVDFDRTIFDSDRLYQDLYCICENHGIGRDLLDPALALVPPENVLFNFFLMVQRSKGIEAAKINHLVAELRAFIRTKGHQYVFEDVRPFLGSAIQAGWKVVVLTYGDHDFQVAKLAGSGIGDLCQLFSITSTPKWDRLEIFNTSSVIFLDDNPRDIDGVKDRFPHVVAVEVKRQNTKYQTALSLKANFSVNQLHWPLRFGKLG
jgi:phosphoglycolate phosphatase-like HAD superfamily hydrolase